MINKYRQSIFAFFSAVALCCSLAACSSDDEPGSDAVNDKSGSFFELNIPLYDNSSTSRAENEAESSEVYEYGTEFENKINKVYLYFFDANKKPVTLSNGKLYTEYDVSLVKGKDTSNELPTGSSLNLSSHYTTGVQRLDMNLQTDVDYYLCVLCNIPLKTTFTSLDQFLDSQMTGDYSTNGMPMSSRDSQGNTYSKFQVHSYNTQSNPVRCTVYVERSLARIAYVDNRLSFPLYPSIDSQDPIEDAYVNIHEIVAFNMLPNWNTFRHVGNISSITFYTSMASDESRFGPIDSDGGMPFVIDPYTSYKNKTASYAKSIYNRWLPNLLTWHPTWTDNDIIDNCPVIDTSTNTRLIAYMPENCMQTSAQVKGQATGVLIRVRFVGDLVPKYVDYAKQHNADGTVYYYNGGFYYNTDQIKSDYPSLTDLTDTNYTNYGVKCFKQGYGYYLYFIRHNDNGNNEVMGPMEFAIVRNNSYDLTVKKVAIPQLTDDDLKNIDPTEPIEEKEVEDYIKIVVTVRPWILRSQSSDLK